MTSSTRALSALSMAVMAALLAGLGWMLVRGPLPSVVREFLEMPPVVPLRQTPAPADLRPAAPAAAPAIQHPVPPLDAVQAAPQDLPGALSELLGSKAEMVRTEGFAPGFVATVDNLGREKASSRLWPIDPVAGRFLVRQEDGREIIAEENHARYAPLVALAQGIDPQAAVSVYRRFYPLFQQAYREQGYPQGYFNDRLIAVIDTLLATPEPGGPLEVELQVVNGPTTLARPWAFYRFADESFESLTAGQKMLLRMGVDNARQVKDRLRAFRRLLATGAG
jgi:hypothetical protein